MRIIIVGALSLIPLVIVSDDMHRQKLAVQYFESFALLFDKMNSLIRANPQEAICLFERLADCSNCSTFCNDVSDMLRQGNPFNDAWCFALNRMQSIHQLSKTDRKELSEFANSFGREKLNDQIRICRFYANHCQEIANRKKTKLDRSRKNSMTIGTLCGALIFIVLY